MTEVEIWMKLFDDKLRFQFIDERIFSGTNCLKYMNSGIYYLIYFNRKTGEVFRVTIDNGGAPSSVKELMYNRYIDIFRDIKLESII